MSLSGRLLMGITALLAPTLGVASNVINLATDHGSIDHNATLYQLGPVDIANRDSSSYAPFQSLIFNPAGPVQFDGAGSSQPTALKAGASLSTDNSGVVASPHDWVTGLSSGCTNNGDGTWTIHVTVSLNGTDYPGGCSSLCSGGTPIGIPQCKAVVGGVGGGYSCSNNIDITVWGSGNYGGNAGLGDSLHGSSGVELARQDFSVTCS